MRVTAFAILLGLTAVVPQNAPPQASRSPRLEALTWQEAERVLTPDSVVLIPLGAASKEHGPHLKLRNDLSLADYFTTRTADATPVVVAPTLTYHYFPAFLEYPGSTSLTLATARDMTTEVVRTLAAYWSSPLLRPQHRHLDRPGARTRGRRACRRRRADALYQPLALRRGHEGRRRTGGWHPCRRSGNVDDAVHRPGERRHDEGGEGLHAIERRIAADTAARRDRYLLADRRLGDPTRATRDKGRYFVDTVANGILGDIKELRSAPLPSRTAPPRATEPPPATAAPVPPPSAPPTIPERCSAGDERTIIAVGAAYSTHWANADAIKLGALWSRNGDMMHPDGTVERGSQAITINRMQLFQRRVPARPATRSP